MRELLEITNDLSQALQRKSQDILNAMHLVSLTKRLLQKCKDDGWEPLLENVNSFCGKHDIEIPDMSARYTAGRGRPRYQRNVITMEHHYRMDIFLVAIDSQLQEINSIFKENVVEFTSS